MSDLRADLEAAIEVVESPSEPVVSTPVIPEAAEPAQSAVDRNRDDKGRFAAKAEEEAAAAQQAAQGAQQATNELQPQEQQQEIPQWSKRPASWKKDMEAHWTTIPEDVRRYIYEREGDVRKGIGQYRAGHEQWSKMEEVFKPYSQTFQQLGVSPTQATQYLLNADAKLRYSPPQEKARYFSELAREYGIDLQQVYQLPPVPPEYQQMQQELNKLRQQQASWEMQQTQSLQTEIESFAENHEHFEAVKPAMSALLQSGQARDLQDAYDKAIWASPEIRASLLQQQVGDAQKKAGQQSLLQRQQAASVSVKGSSPASGSAGGPKGTLREEILAAWDAHS